MDRKSILSWALYDWANSAFATTVMAGFFPLFFNAYWADPNNPAESTFFLGLANSTYAIIVALMAPFLEQLRIKEIPGKNSSFFLRLWELFSQQLYGW